MNILKKVDFPAGNSLYDNAPFDVRRRLHETFARFNVNVYHEVIGESLLRLEKVCHKSRYLNLDSDDRTHKLFDMLDYYKKLK